MACIAKSALQLYLFHLIWHCGRSVARRLHFRIPFCAGRILAEMEFQLDLPNISEMKSMQITWKCKSMAIVIRETRVVFWKKDIEWLGRWLLLIGYHTFHLQLHCISTALTFFLLHFISTHHDEFIYWTNIQYAITKQTNKQTPIPTIK